VIELSRRYAATVVVLCLMAAVPVYVHSAGLLARDDCAHPEALRGTLPIPGMRPGPPPRRLPRGAIQLRGGTLAWRAAAAPLRFSIERTYQPVHLLNPPQRIAKAFQVELQETQLVRREEVEIPVHWAVDRTRGAPQFAAYAFVYRGRPHRDPIRSLFGSTWAQITTGARPFTLFVVGGSVSPRQLPEARQAAEDWLVAAWHHYDAVCNVESPAAE